PLAAAEVERVGSLERSQALERAHRRLDGRARRPRQVERGVVLQDRALEVLQRAARLESELFRKDLAGLPVDLERVGLASRPVKREHQLPAQALLERVRLCQSFELRDELVAAAEREVGVDAVHQRREAELL